jgi:hypothetical protein
MPPHLSEHPIGTEFELSWHHTKHQWCVAKLVRRSTHGEEWRVNVIKAHIGGEGSYLMTEGWRWVNEQRIGAETHV